MDDKVVVDSEELKYLARGARQARGEIEAVRSRVAATMGGLDRRGWNAEAADSAAATARNGMATLWRAILSRLRLALPAACSR